MVARIAIHPTNVDGRYTYKGSDRTPGILEARDKVRAATKIAVDVETVSLDDRSLIGISFTPNAYESFYFPFNPDSNYQFIKDVLSNPAVVKIFHNGHFDIRLLEDLYGIQIQNVLDTMTIAQLIGHQALSLAALALYYFNIQLPTIEELLGKKGKKQKTMLDIDESLVADKCCWDTLYTWYLYHQMESSCPKDALDLEMRYQPVIMDIERRGMLVDRERLLEHKTRIQKSKDYYRMVCEGMGFNPGSSEQVAGALQRKMHKIPYKKGTGKPRMDKNILKNYYSDDPITHLVLNYRSDQTLLNNFIDPMLSKHIQPNGRIYGSINTTTTVSGRTSRSNPNLQNQPPILRDIFIASDGYELEEWDLSQIELRVLAWMVSQQVGDFSMQRLFEEEGVSGEVTDIHMATAKAIFGIQDAVHRQIAKQINFAVVYGGNEYTLLEKFSIPLEKGWEFIQRYFETFPGIKTLMDQTRREIYETGYSYTELGRLRYFGDKDLDNTYLMDEALREGFNHKVQGTAGEILKEMQLRACEEPQINMVHDSVHFEIPKGYQLPHDCSVDLREYRTPMDVKQGQNWKDSQKIGVFG